MSASVPLRVLLTGFEPFGGHAANPSASVADALAAAPPPGIALDVAVLPTAFDRAALRLDRLLDARTVDAVLLLGLAGGRSGLTLERVAVNLRDARIPDNDGAQPIDAPCVPGAPAAYFSTLPVKRMAAAIRDAGVEAAISHSAGTFVCNHVLFAVLHRAALAASPGTSPGASPDASPSAVPRAAFIHLPFLPDQADAPTLPLDAQVSGIRAALAELAGPRGLAADAPLREGALW